MHVSPFRILEIIFIKTRKERNKQNKMWVTEANAMADGVIIRIKYS